MAMTRVCWEQEDASMGGDMRSIRNAPVPEYSEALHQNRTVIYLLRNIASIVVVVPAGLTEITSEDVIRRVEVAWLD